MEKENDIIAGEAIAEAPEIVESREDAEAPADTVEAEGTETAAEKTVCTPCGEGLKSRLGKVGGQAVLEGVMMKAGEHSVTTCRKEDGSLVVCDDSFKSVRAKNKLLNLPIIRGVVNLVEMLKLSIKTLSNSAEALGLEEEDGKTERWMKKHLGIGLTDFIMIIGTVLGVGLALFLFMFLPAVVADGIDALIVLLGGSTLGIWRAAVEGAAKVLIFLTYLWLVALMPDIKRTFMYHGAEHKTIACFEAGEELTPENAMKHKRFHRRCGTSFMFFMILLGIIAGLFVRLLFEEVIGITLPGIAYVGIRLLILPLVVGIGYEFIMYAGKHDNLFTRALSAPGLWVQRITTREPTLDMLEVAIVSTKCALREEFPEFMEYFKARPWEAKPEVNEAEVSPDGEADNGACINEAEPTVGDAEINPSDKVTAEGFVGGADGEGGAE